MNHINPFRPNVLNLPQKYETIFWIGYINRYILTGLGVMIFARSSF